MDIISEIDAELARLRPVRALLVSTGDSSVSAASATPTRRRRKPSKPQAKAAEKAEKRTMSPEARKRIADAQRARWAKQKKAAKKATAKGAAKAEAPF